MEKQTNDSLAKAVAYLGAVEVAPGRYAWHTKRFPYTSGAWLTANSDYLLEASYDGVEIHERFATLMPPWWTPEQRFAWRVFNGTGSKIYGDWTPATLAKRFKNLSDLLLEVNASDGDYERITADLETGAEMPC